MFTCDKDEDSAAFFWMGFAAGVVVGAAITMFVLSEKGKGVGGRIKELTEKKLYRKEEGDKGDASQPPPAKGSE